MSPDNYSRFAESMAHYICLLDGPFQEGAHSQAIEVEAEAQAMFRLDMTPFAATPQPVTAMAFFDGVMDVPALLDAYTAASQSLPFENDLPEARENVSAYADDFMAMMLVRGRDQLTDVQARLIAAWVKHLDVYCAVKAVESFLYSKADVTLLEIAPHYGWDVVYDHMAIRCGSGAHQDAERISELLRDKHGYVSTQFAGEAFYQFPDGWNAYPVYKILENGQVLRVFVDQSDADDKSHIIQHWNRVYGYTTHHLGIRATMLKEGVRVAVPLDDVMAALAKEGVDILTPTGQYTGGLLLQVFTRPEKNSAIPADLKAEIVQHGAQLEKTIENAKLLELVSRREMPPGMAMQYFALYGLVYNAADPLHSAPVYQYFLPAQAAHVIKTSQVVSA